MLRTLVETEPPTTLAADSKRRLRQRARWLASPARNREGNVKKSIRWLSVIVAAGASALLVTPEVSADDCPELARLAAQWWQWAVSIPPSVNPLTDTTGQDCMVGQHGDTWFLGGLLGNPQEPLEEPGVVERFCQVPSDR